MSLSPIRPDQLKPGDVLLLITEHPPLSGYVKALFDYIRYLKPRNDDEKKIKEQAWSTIIRGLIMYFDGNHFFHASIWDGEKVAEAGTEGIARGDIARYKSFKTSVYRFSKNGKVVMGTPEFPSQPVIDVSNSIIAQKLPYSYTTAVLLALLCYTRWQRDEWIDRIEQFFIENLSRWMEPFIREWFKRNRKELRKVFEQMVVEAIEIILAFRKEKGMVCSEFVAAVYNRAEPVPKYFLEKSYKLTLEANKSIEQETIDMNEELLLAIEQELQTIDLQSYEMLLGAESDIQLLEWLKSDELYTPADLSNSPNLTQVGELHFD
jgi:hypothetical protein